MNQLRLLLTISLFTTVTCHRTFSHSPGELAETDTILLGQGACKPAETPVLIHTAAVNSGKYYQRRMAIRQTWATEATGHGLRVIFVLGRARNAAVQKALASEATQFGDILQFSFTDAYFNITLKAVAELKWVARYCGNSRALVRLDDDVLLNVPALVRLLKKETGSGGLPGGISGRVLTTAAHRATTNKWYMPPAFYKAHCYTFVQGFAYILAREGVQRLVARLKVFNGPVLDIDDIWITGVLADAAQVTRYHSDAFRHACAVEPCLMESSLVLHGCAEGEMMKRVYAGWKKANVTRCQGTETNFEARPAVQVHNCIEQRR